MNQSVETIKGKEEEKKRGGREEEREEKRENVWIGKKILVRGIELTTFTMSTLLYIH